MKYIIVTIFLTLNFSVYSKSLSDSVEYTHIYISDTSKVVKKYKEVKGYVNPFSPVTYFSIQLPSITNFKLSLCDSNVLSKLTLCKVIFQDTLEKGNYRIEKIDLSNDYHGIYYYHVEFLDTNYFRRVIITK